MGFIRAKFASKCEETGFMIKPKELCFFDIRTRRTFHKNSPRFKHELLQKKNEKYFPK